MKATLQKIEISNIGTVLLAVPDSQYLAREIPADQFFDVQTLSINGVGFMSGVVRKASTSDSPEQPSLYGVAIVYQKTDPFINFQGRDYRVDTIPRADSDEVRLTARYCAAWLTSQFGYWDSCLKILARSIRDKWLVDQVSASFTRIERLLAVEAIFDCVENPTLRFRDGQSGPNYIPGTNSTCVMDLLHLLRDAGARYYPWHPEGDEYSRISAKTVDEKSIFTPAYESDDNKESVYAEFTTLLLTNGLFNISVRSRIPGTVELNPRSAERVNLPRKLPTYEYRRFTLIEDGKLNVKKIVVGMTQEQARTLMAKKYRLKQLGEEMYLLTLPEHIFNYSYSPEKNPSWFKGTVLADGYRETLLCETKKYVLRQLLQQRDQAQVAAAYKALVPAGRVDRRHQSVRYERRSLDQIKVLKDHGINLKGNYIGIERMRERPDAALTEKTVREYRLQIQGFSSIPELSKVLEKVRVSGESVKLSPAQKLVYDYYMHVVDLETIDLVRFLMECNKLIERHRLNTWTTMTLTELLGFSLTGRQHDKKTEEDYVVAPNGTKVYIKHKLVSPVSATASYVD